MLFRFRCFYSVGLFFLLFISFHFILVFSSCDLIVYFNFPSHHKNARLCATYTPLYLAIVPHIMRYNTIQITYSTQNLDSFSTNLIMSVCILAPQISLSTFYIQSIVLNCWSVHFLFVSFLPHFCLKISVSLSSFQLMISKIQLDFYDLWTWKCSPMFQHAFT